MYDSVTSALDALEDPYLFERVATLVLLDEHPNLQWTGGRRDRGRDAVEVNGLLGDVDLVVQYSIAEDWKRKLRGELRRYETDATLPRQYVFVTPVQTYEEDRLVLVEEARRHHDVRLDIRGRGWLEPRLDGPHRRVAEEHLQVRSRVPGRFVTRSRYRQLLRVPGFDAPLVGVDDPLARLSGLLADGTRCVMLTGPGGMGKTRIALENVPDGMQTYVLARAADLDREALTDLPAGIEAVVVVDNAHRANDVRGIRHLLDDDRWSGYRVILTVRPGHETAVRTGAHLESNELVTLALRPMRRTEIDQILRNAPYRLRREDLRLSIQGLAGGVPLIAHLAAEGVRGGGLDRTGVAGLLRRYVTTCLDSAGVTLGPAVLEAVAAAGRITRDQLEPLAQHLEGPRRDVRLAAAALADAGLLEDDGRSYSVSPESLRPVIIADAYLNASSDLQTDYLALLELLRPNRTSVLEGLAEAVSLLDGDGAQLLRRIVQMSAPPAEETSAGAWNEALREVPAYAVALPGDAAHLVRRFAASWPPQPSGQEFGITVDAARVLMTAAAAATSLARVDIGLAAALLLDLAELEDSEGASPTGTVHDQLRRLVADVVPEQPDRTTSRSQQLVESLRASVKGEIAPRRAHAMIRVLLTLMTPELEFSRTSANQEAAITWGRLPAPDTTEHRRVVREAAELVAELVPQLHERGLLGLAGGVDDFRRASRRISDEIEDDARTGRLRRSVDEAARTITRAMLARWNMLPVAVRFRLAATQPRSSLVRSRVADDEDVQRLLALYGDARVRRHWRREERRARTAGRNLAGELGATAGITWVLRVLPQLDQVPTGHAGEFAMLEELGSLQESAKAVRSTAALARTWETARGIGSFLAGFLRAHPADADAIVRTLAENPRTALHLSSVLDHISADAELELVEALLSHDDRETNLMVARHLDGCDRIDDSLRADWLLEVAERFEGEDLARALTECIDHLDHLDFDSFLKNVARLILHDGGLSHGAEDLVYRAVARHDVDAFMDLVERRVRALLDGHISFDGLTDAVPQAVNYVLSELDQAARGKAMRRTADLLEAIESHPNSWYAEEQLWELLRGIGPDDDAYTELLARWADDGPHGIDRAIRGLEGLEDSDRFLVMARELAARGLAAEQQARLLHAGDPTLHGFVDSAAARDMAEILRRWQDDADPNVRTFARFGVQYLEDRAQKAENDLRSLHGNL